MAKRSVELRASRLFRAWVAEVHAQVVWAVNVSKPAELREKLWIWKRPGSRSAGCERTFDVRKRGTSMLPAIFPALGFSTMADDMIRGPIVVKEIRASHPRLFLNSAEIGKARERIRSSHGPWEVAWQRFRERVDALLKSGREPQPYVGDEEHRFYYATVWRRRRPGDGVIARDLALAYVLSRDERYAEAAIAYLVAWANASPAPGGHMDSSKTPRGEPISGGVGSSVARGMIPFAYAYDLLYDHPSLRRADKSRIETWFRATTAQIRRGISLWHDNDYFDRQEYQNHVVAHMTGLAVIGYVLGDREMVQFALDDPQNPRDFRELIQGTIFMRSDPPHHRELRYTRLPTQTGEIYDRYRHYTARGGIPRGLQYAHLSLGLLTIAAEAACHNGLDLYRYEADTGESLSLPYEFYADFYRIGDSTINGGYYSGESDRIGTTGDSTGLFELGLARYPNSDTLMELITSVDRSSSEHTALLLGPTVITHGIDLDAVVSKE